MQLVLLFLILFPIVTYANGQDKVLVDGCSLFNISGEHLKNFPGDMCIYLDNGDLVSADDDQLRYFTNKQKVKWEIKGIFHHQMNLSADGDKILTIANTVQTAEDQTKKVFDQLSVISLDGKVLHSIDSSTMLKQVNVPSMNDPIEEGIFKNDYKEGSHFNSFYQIPALNKNAKVPSFIKEGNYIANSIRLGIFVLDSTLTKVLFHWKSPFSEDHSVHDAQITTSGKLLYFNNVAEESTPENRFSTIDEINLNTMKKSLEIKGNPATFFYSYICGGVQDLPGGLILFSHNYAGVFIYDRAKKKIIYSNYLVYFLGRKINPTLDIKAKDLTSFLSLWNK